MDSPIRLLLIDDDRALCELLGEYLGRAGFSVEAAHDGAEGVRRALSESHAIVVLDVMLPQLDGFEALRRIRAKSRIPVLMLTARGEEVDRVVGLEIGADDYLAKPFSPRELAARLQAILRRAQPAREGAARNDALVVEDVELDAGMRRVRRGGEQLELTGTEFSLLEALLQAAGRIVSREALSERVLGRALQPYDRSIDMHVSNVRKKLGPAADGSDRIRGIRGAGYIFLTSSGRRDAEEDAAGAGG